MQHPHTCTLICTHVWYILTLICKYPHNPYMCTYIYLNIQGINMHTYAYTHTFTYIYLTFCGRESVEAESSLGLHGCLSVPPLASEGMGCTHPPPPAESFSHFPAIYSHCTESKKRPSGTFCYVGESPTVTIFI